MSATSAYVIPGQLVLNKSSVLNLVCVLSFFPFFSFIPGLQAEVQPYCYIAAFLFFSMFQRKLPYAFFLLFIICVLYYIAFALSDMYQDLSLVLQSLPHLLIYLGPPVFFWVLYKNFGSIGFRVLHTIFYIWVAVGLLQQWFPNVFEAVGLKKILEVLIPRFSVTNLGGWGDRGVTSLSNEPSYAGIILFGLYVSVIYRFMKGWISRKNLLLNTGLYLLSLFYNASVTMFILTLLLLLAYIYQTRSYRVFFLVVALAIAPFFIFQLNFRIIDLIAVLPDMLRENEWNPYYVMIGPLGSHREFSSYVGLKSGLYHFFGNGYYSSLTSFIDVAKQMKVDLARAFFFDYTFNGYYVNMKPYGYGVLVLFELGVIPFLLFNSVLIRLLNRHKKKGGTYKRFGIFLATGLLLLINLNTPASLPTYWFAFVVALFMMTMPVNENTNAGAIPDVARHNI